MKMKMQKKVGSECRACKYLKCLYGTRSGENITTIIDLNLFSMCFMGL